MSLSQLPHPHWDFPTECAPSRETTNSQGPEGSRLAEAVELSKLKRYPRPCEDWPTEEELRRFWKLRQEIVEKEQAEVLENQLLAVELPPNLRAMLRAREDVGPGPRHARRCGQKPRAVSSVLAKLKTAWHCLLKPRGWGRGRGRVSACITVACCTLVPAGLWVQSPLMAPVRWSHNRKAPVPWV